jgi:hypothetical protein
MRNLLGKEVRVDPLGPDGQEIADDAGCLAWLTPGTAHFPEVWIADDDTTVGRIRANFAAVRFDDECKIAVHFRTVRDGRGADFTEIALTDDTAQWLVEALTLALAKKQ